MKTVTLNWTKRAAILIAEGPEQSVIQWLDDGSEQTINSAHMKVGKTTESFAELTKKHKVKKEGPKRGREHVGPTKQQLANEIVAANPTKSRQELIALVVAGANATPAGAATFVYNAKKNLVAPKG